MVFSGWQLNCMFSRFPSDRVGLLYSVLAVSCACAYGQQPLSQPPDTHAFGIFPNYRTMEESAPFQPISATEKLKFAAKDSFDWSLPVLSAGFAGLEQLTDAHSELGQGLSGYGNRLVRNYSNHVVGNFLVEGTLPSVLHEDPRYFRRGKDHGLW